MPTVDDLSPDQRAVVQLLLRQDKTYTELAVLLRTTPEAVRARASAALGALGPAIDDTDRDQLSDWLLGQLGELDTEGVLDLIDASPAALEWALEVSDALRASGLEPRGELPDEIEEDEPPVAPTPPPPPARVTPAGAPAEPIAVAADRPLPGFRAAADDEAPRPSRLGGILLIVGAVVVVVAIVIVLLVRGGDDSSNDTVSVASTSTAAQTATTQATTQAQNTVEAQVNMSATAAGKDGIGVAQFITDGVDHAVVVTGQRLPANGANDIYALWLTGGTNGKASALLGYSPKAVGKNGRFVGTITLPDDAADFHQIVLTREDSKTKATTPGTVILRGSLG